MLKTKPINTHTLCEPNIEAHVINIVQFAIKIILLHVLHGS